jgi:hypothetical protein
MTKIAGSGSTPKCHGSATLVIGGFRHYFTGSQEVSVCIFRAKMVGVAEEGS